MTSRLLLALLLIGLWVRADSQTVRPPATLSTQTMVDANLTVTSGITNVVTSVALTADRSVFIPPAAAYCNACTLTISDFGFVASPGNNLIIDASGTDTINGRGFATLSQPWSTVVLRSNGSNAWNIQGQAADISNAAFATAFNPLGVSQGPLALLNRTPVPVGAPGAGVVWLMATKGTNPGTCALVVQAGLSTTPFATKVIDNIPGGGFALAGVGC